MYLYILTPYSVPPPWQCPWQWPWRTVSGEGRRSCSGSWVWPAPRSQGLPTDTVLRKTVPSAQRDDNKNTHLSAHYHKEKCQVMCMPQCMCVSHYLRKLLVFERYLSVVTDLPQSCPKAPLICCYAQISRVLYTLRSNPRNPVHTLCRQTQSTLSDWIVSKALSSNLCCELCWVNNLHFMGVSTFKHHTVVSTIIFTVFKRAFHLTHDPLANTFLYATS